MRLPQNALSSITKLDHSLAAKGKRQGMGYEIDFLSVGTGEKSGDAIAFRIWRENYFWVFVIDGGYTESGDALVKHINHYYGTNTVNLVILTHPDDDHARGTLRVVEQMKVDNLWMPPALELPGARPPVPEQPRYRRERACDPSSRPGCGERRRDSGAP